MDNNDPTVNVEHDGENVAMPRSQSEANLQAEHEAMQSAPEAQQALVADEPAADAVQEREPPVNEREAKLEAIAAKRMAEMTAKPEPVADAEVADEPAEDEPEQKKGRHKIKVYGEEESLTFEEMKVWAQKGRAADKVLQESSEYRNRIKELEEKLARQSSASLPDKDGTQKPALPKLDGPMEFTADMIDQAVYDGNESGQKAREELARRLNQQPTDPAQIKAQIRLEMRVEQAIDSLSEADPIAKQMLHDASMSQIVDRYSSVLLDLEPHLSERDNIAKAIRQAREHFPELAEKPATMNPSKSVNVSKAAHSAGNTSTTAQRINMAKAPPTVEQAQMSAKAQLRAMRGLNH